MAECFISPGHSSHSNFWSKLIDAVDESVFTLSAARYNKCPLSLQPGNLLISLALTLSVEFSISIALHAATQAGVPWLLPLWDFSHHDESHPMDHDSNSSGTHHSLKPDSIHEARRLALWAKSPCGPSAGSPSLT